MNNLNIMYIIGCLILAIVPGLAVSAPADIIPQADIRAGQHFEKANELLKLMEYEAAIAEYEKVLSLSPKGEIARNAQYWIGQSHFRAGRFDAAQATFAKLIEQYPVSSIVSVTKLMTDRVEKAKENEKTRKIMNDALDKGIVIDPETGVKYTKAGTLAGKSDVISYYPPGASLSPNGRFLLYGKLIVPLDGGDPFDLVEIPANHCSWSPDGEKVIFCSEGAICVVPVSAETAQPAGPVKKLLDGGTYGRFTGWVHPSWSPDSESIVFRKSDEENIGKYLGVWRLSVGDGKLTRITDRGSDPIWSPDGKTIAYKKRAEKAPILETWLVPAGGGTPRKIDIEQGRLLFWSWSTDSEWLVYMLGRKLQLYNIADERAFDIVPPEGVGEFFSWSSDRKKLLFLNSSYDYRANLEVVSTSGGPSIELGENLTLWPYNRFWSPDSRMIVADGQKKDGESCLWIIPLAGGEPFPLELDVSVSGNPEVHSLSPDCGKLLFSVRQSENSYNLWIVPVSLKDGRTTGAPVMTFEGWVRADPRYSFNHLFSWSPDGGKFVITHNGDIWMAFCNGDKPIRLTNTPQDENTQRWSPDGGMIVYYSYSPEKQALRVIAVSGSVTNKILEVPLTSIVSATGFARNYTYAWSPDSKEIALLYRTTGYGKQGMPFSRDEGEISAISVESGKIRQVLDLSDQPMDQAYGLSWSPDGKKLGLAGWNSAGNPKCQLIIVSAEGGEVAGIAANNRGGSIDLYDGASWSPDGKWISYTFEGMFKTRPESTIWEADFEEIVSKLSD